MKHATYDPVANAGYIYLTDALRTVAKTVQTAEGVNLDYDDKGRLIGLELMTFALFPPDVQVRIQT